MTVADPAHPAHATPEPVMKPGSAHPDVHRPNRPFPTVPLDEAGLALRLAWVTYLGMALIPPAAMIAAIFYLLFTGNDRILQGPTADAGPWGIALLVVGMTFLGLATPAAFYLRSRLWSDFYDGGVVRPKNYLRGWVAVWVPLVASGTFGFIALALTREFSVVFVSLMAFIVFLAMFPNGHALTRPVGHDDDPGTYEEPR